MDRIINNNIRRNILRRLQYHRLRIILRRACGVLQARYWNIRRWLNINPRSRRTQQTRQNVRNRCGNGCGVERQSDRNIRSTSAPTPAMNAIRGSAPALNPIQVSAPAVAPALIATLASVPATAFLSEGNPVAYVGLAAPRPSYNVCTPEPVIPRRSIRLHQPIVDDGLRRAGRDSNPVVVNLAIVNTANASPAIPSSTINLSTENGFIGSNGSWIVTNVAAQNDVIHIRGPGALTQPVDGPSTSQASPHNAIDYESDPGTDATYRCPVCFELVRMREPMTTKCGHIFCNDCITGAINGQHRCPLCNRKLNIRQIQRIFI